MHCTELKSVYILEAFKEKQHAAHQQLIQISKCSDFLIYRCRCIKKWSSETCGNLPIWFMCNTILSQGQQKLDYVTAQQWTTKKWWWTTLQWCSQYWSHLGACRQYNHEPITTLRWKTTRVGGASFLRREEIGFIRIQNIFKYILSQKQRHGGKLHKQQMCTESIDNSRYLATRCYKQQLTSVKLHGINLPLQCNKYKNYNTLWLYSNVIMINLHIFYPQANI